ncbi:MAG: hypothetical protein FWD57_06605 [Polyangiaceae bacterium]|nr:hypothetical protein [Polyangiaceae bacterium]
MSRRHALPERDQDPTGFTRILQTLIDAVPGVVGVALVDELGECVDYCGVMDAYEIRLVAAHSQIELHNADVRLRDGFGPLRSFTVYASKRTYFSMRIVEEYDLVLVFAGPNPSAPSLRALAQAEFDIRVEGGWHPPRDMERWILLKVDARPHDKWRPCRVQLAGEWHEVEVIGTVVGLSHGERGFRVSTISGAEMTLVRERHGNWYADVRY